jgi:NAD:arginine ADP-ribosyltransferase
MNFKKWIYSVVLVLFFTVPSLAEKSVFFGKGEEVLQGAGSVWKTFLDDAFVAGIKNDVIANTTLRDQFPNLSIDELTAIKVYTSDQMRNGSKIYQTLNAELRAGSLSDFNKGLSDLLESGISKLPDNTSNAVYRGVYGQEATLAKTWSKNDVIEFKDFKSSSLSNSEALKFMSRNNGDVFFEILNPKGKNVCPVSCSVKELEILFRKGSKFDVMDVKDGFNFLDPNDPLTVLATGRKVVLRLK